MTDCNHCENPAEVLEHPEASHAWRHHGICIPSRWGSWISAGLFHPGYTCCVEQGHYGHPARKATWLYAAHVELPELRWGSCGPRMRMDDGYRSAEERRRRVRTGITQRLSKRQRAIAPTEFAELLVAIARTATSFAALQARDYSCVEAKALGDQTQ